MRLTVRSVGWAIIGTVTLLCLIATVEICTSMYRIEEFTRRTGRIREGMTESEVRNAAGVPETLIADLERATDPSAPGASCRDARATAAMLYTLDNHGWFGSHLGWTAAVVCLDARRVVVSTHLEMMTF